MASTVKTLSQVQSTTTQIGPEGYSAADMQNIERPAGSNQFFGMAEGLQEIVRSKTLL
eukprot:CAMPEP_0195019936 /NCGR_PEP_ID=MMETSP0326_2-20130528/33968_1 /TAXON_ID=2866 ORGANISM="Crypthecodinium cohnii, Strain Seligo" /NCGR_SAMPLE_ID=MMETSP0326_2 /ASSEMBLY_ACC=CAM_ASM_000348 /LENGTH=57 /DNA_ID=CAMNT_0040038279 /DNA_START=341 /DNA_END=514 /DNA_ORIENTATION=+